MNEEVAKLNSRSLTHLFISLAKSRKKILDRERKKKYVMQSIDRIREISEKTTKRSAILEELQKIESKVSDLAEKQTSEDAMLRKLQEKYDVQPRQIVKSLGNFEEISHRLQDNVQKLKKIEAEEVPKIEIIREEKDKIHELKQIEGQLRIIELKYNKLKSKKQNLADLKRLKEMIDRYKKMITEMKSSK